MSIFLPIFWWIEYANLEEELLGHWICRCSALVNIAKCICGCSGLDTLVVYENSVTFLYFSHFVCVYWYHVVAVLCSSWWLIILFSFHMWLVIWISFLKSVELFYTVFFCRVIIFLLVRVLSIYCHGFLGVYVLNFF